MKHTCPVCGFNEMRKPPKDDMICPCCGTHFGYDDEDCSSEDLRDEWIDGGMLWFSRHTPAPLGWSAIRQLRNAGLEYTGRVFLEYVAQKTSLSKMTVMSTGVDDIVSNSRTHVSIVTLTQSEVIGLTFPMEQIGAKHYTANTPSVSNTLCLSS